MTIFVQFGLGCFNKMASAGSKTPVSILNEYLIRKGFVPKFSMIANGSGTHNPSFTYIVQYAEHRAIGNGRSKQEAKHEAAKQMLEYLKISCEEEYQEDVQQLVVPHENAVGYNAVGILTEYCKKMSYPEAKYFDHSEVGPPHAKVFTVQCCVSQLSTYGKSGTKKQAKQIAAHKMVMQLKNEAGDKPMAVALPNKVPINIDELNFPESSKVTPVYMPQPLLYKDYSNAYSGLHDKSETIFDIVNNRVTVNQKTACELIEKIREELVVDVTVEGFDEKGTLIELPTSILETHEDIEGDENSQYNGMDYRKVKIVGLTLQLNPQVTALGSNIPETCQKLLQLLTLLCK